MAFDPQQCLSPGEISPRYGSESIVWPSNCPICMMVLYKVLGTFGNTFSITDDKGRVPFIVLVSNFSGTEEREEARGKLSGFYRWVNKPWPQTKIAKVSLLLRATRLLSELNPTCLCLLVHGRAVGFTNIYTPTVSTNALPWR